MGIFLRISLIHFKKLFLSVSLLEKRITETVTDTDVRTMCKKFEFSVWLL